MKTRDQAPGFSILELLVSLAIFSMAMGGLAVLLVQNSQINRTEQLSTEAQANARNCLSMVVQVLRSAGWDPKNSGLAAVTLDATPLDPVNTIEVFADLNEDGDTSDADEDVLIRHTGNQIDWRKTSDVLQPFVVLADNISNDANGDSVVEPMFVADSVTNPARITVQITARSATPDPRTGNYLRYTVRSEVVLRKNL